MWSQGGSGGVAKWRSGTPYDSLVAKYKNEEARYDAGFEGVLVYDRAQKRITEWDMVALGDYAGLIGGLKQIHGKDAQTRS